MVQLPGSKKRHAEMATAATVKAEVEDLGCGDGSPHKHVKPMPQPPPQPPPPEVHRPATWAFFFLASLWFCSRL